MSTNNYGEPWKFNLDMDAVPITRADGTEVIGNCEINEPDLVRAVTCVNACADIPDPAAAIQVARDALGAFASVFNGDLEDVGGGTVTKTELTVQMFKDAKLALKLLTPSKP